MGFLDKIKGKAEGEEKKKERPIAPAGKYDEPCSLCGEPGTEKKWMGQYWHKKCVRQMKKAGRKMI